MPATPPSPTRIRTNSRGRTVDGAPNPIDVHVGARLRLRRSLLGISQQTVAKQLGGLSFQQLQKYEQGTNRIGASRLFDLANILDVPVSFFFDGMADEVAAASPRGLANGAPLPKMPADPAMSPDSISLLRAYHEIPDNQVRRKMLELARVLASRLPDAAE